MLMDNFKGLKKMTKHALIKSSNKTVTAYDIFGKKHKRNLKDFKFRVSAYGIFIKNGKILLQKNPVFDQYCLPGGGVELGETITEGLVREFEEETGIKVKPKRLISVEENLFTYENEDFHNILIFFKVERIGGKLSPLNKEDSIEAKFVRLSKLTLRDIRRVFWNTIKKLKAGEAG